MGPQGGQKDRTRSNWCIKEREEERKTRDSKGSWKEPYLDPKRASKKASMGPLKGPIMNLKGPIGPYGSIGAPLGLLRGPIGALRGPNHEP
jgi:hypothetical protein